jgi:hypothetical protein
MKQGVGVDRAFMVTSNRRVQTTYVDTKRFADALRKYDKQIKAHLKSMKGALPCAVLSSGFATACGI